MLEELPSSRPLRESPISIRHVKMPGNGCRFVTFGCGFVDFFVDFLDLVLVLIKLVNSSFASGMASYAISHFSYFWAVEWLRACLFRRWRSMNEH